MDEWGTQRLDDSTDLNDENYDSYASVVEFCDDAYASHDSVVGLFDVSDVAARESAFVEVWEPGFVTRNPFSTHEEYL